MVQAKIDSAVETAPHCEADLCRLTTDEGRFCNGKTRHLHLPQVQVFQSPSFTRREFLQGAALLAANVAAGSVLAACAPNSTATPTTSATSAANRIASDKPIPANYREVKHYEKLADGIVQCTQCPRDCVIPQGRRGFCSTRENREGKLYSVVYGKPCIARTVPVERAPIYHMMPGTQSYSIATAGCNLACLYCQNYAVARATPEEVEAFDLTPEQVVAKAIEQNCKSVTFSYNEMSVAQEFMLGVASLAHAKGLKTVLKTGGYIKRAPLVELCAAMDAINVDLKGYSNKFYQQVCQGELKYVLETIVTVREENKAWLEVANLVVPTYNDDPKLIGELVKWFLENIGADVPFYFTRYEPAYRMRMPPTPIETMERARKIALDVGVKYVYIGNLPGHAGAHTYCPRCQKILVERVGFEIKQNNIVKGACKFCGEPIAGRWVT